jgi:hypothetical protein
LFVHVAAGAHPPFVLGAADLNALWSACARALADPLGRLVRRACADPDPRARALAGRRLIALTRGRARSPYDEALVALVAASAVPDWIRIEAFLCLWRTQPAGRRRWVALALDADRAALGPVAVRAALESDLPLAPLLARDPARVARELDAVWRLGTERERARLRERVEDLDDVGWRNLRSAAGPDAAATFAALAEARRGTLSAPDLAGGALALAPDPPSDPTEP